MLDEEIRDKKGISIDKPKKEKTEQKREIRREMTKKMKERKSEENGKKKVSIKMERSFCCAVGDR